MIPFIDMVFTKQLLLLLLSVILVIAGDTNSNSNENVIPAVVHYLRKHNPHYYYTSGSIIQSSIKDNKLHVQSDIEATCTFPCTGGILSCNSVLEKSEDNENWKVTSTTCAPKEPHFEGIKEYSPEPEKPLVQESKKIANNEPSIISRRTNHCTGCPIDIDTNAAGVNKLVSAALKHVESEREAKHVLVKVLRVQEQVVAGIKYTLLIEIAPTICAKSVGAIECPIDSEKEKFICEVQYWEKPWLHSSLIVKNNCTTSQNYQVEEPINTTKKPRIEPDFLSELEAQIIPETELRQHKDPVYQNYQEPSVNYYDLDFEPIPEVVVNRRQIRDIRSNTRKGDVFSSSSSSSEESEGSRTVKKGHKDSSSSSESSSSSSSSEESTHKNRKSEKEDVEGLLPVIKKYFNSKNIDIIKYSKLDLDETHFKLDILVEKGGDYDECRLHVIKNGDTFNEIVNKKCGKDRFKRDALLLGGIKDTDLNDPAIKAFLNDGLKHLDSQSTHTNRYKVKEVLKATKQVVSGFLWKVKVKIVLSNCEKGKPEDIETCGENSDPHERICDIVIHDVPWLKEGRQTNITCETDVYSFRTRRDTNFIENSSIELRFLQFISQFQKDYDSKLEYLLRLRIFEDNLHRIYLLNKYEKGTAHYDITKFADLTPNEFSHMHGLRPDLRSENDVPLQEAAIPDIELPQAFDWRTKKAVTEVKDQGMCGSCWAFSTTGNVEGQYAIKYNRLKEFSEQELVDCDKLDDGCNGGLMDNAYRTIERLGGLELESEYPYEGEDEKCHFNKSKAIVQLKGAVNISHDETDMAKWLTQNGPIAIAINANAMQFYAGGVSHPWKALCNPNELDHGVLIVGYGVHTYPLFNKTLPYWIVKNSWGKTWGEQGYYRVYRGDGTCGLNETPSSAIVA